MSKADPSFFPESGVGSNKPWWRRYEMTLSAVFFFALIVGYQELFLRANPPPRFEQLKSETVEVLSWQRLYPQLRVRLSSGKIRWVEFPTLSMRRDDYKAIPFDEQCQLVGATCLMAGRPLGFSGQDRYQVFLLDCPEDKGLSFAESIKHYERSYQNRSGFFWEAGVYFYLFAVGLVFWAELVRDRNFPEGVE